MKEIDTTKIYSLPNSCSFTASLQMKNDILAEEEIFQKFINKNCKEKTAKRKFQNIYKKKYYMNLRFVQADHIVVVEKHDLSTDYMLFKRHSYMFNYVESFKDFKKLSKAKLFDLHIAHFVKTFGNCRHMMFYFQQGKEFVYNLSKSCDECKLYKAFQEKYILESSLAEEKGETYSIPGYFCILYTKDANLFEVWFSEFDLRRMSKLR